MTWTDLAPEEARDLLQTRAETVVLDVRTPPEHGSHRIAGARLVPVAELPGRLYELDPAAPYLVVCEHGIRSTSACALLADADFEQLHNLRGGMAHWIAAGLAVERGP